MPKRDILMAEQLRPLSLPNWTTLAAQASPFPVVIVWAAQEQQEWVRIPRGHHCLACKAPGHQWSSLAAFCQAAPCPWIFPASNPTIRLTVHGKWSVCNLSAVDMKQSFSTYFLSNRLTSHYGRVHTYGEGQCGLSHVENQNYLFLVKQEQFQIQYIQ